jgi:hypothetical protein
MKWIDFLFAWVMVALGVVSCAFTFRAHGFSSLAPYYGGLFIVLAGLVNVVRAQIGKSTGLMRITASFANIIVLIPASANTVTMRTVLRQNPQVPVLAIAALIELLFSFQS